MQPFAIHAYACRSCGALRTLTASDVANARRQLERFCTTEAELVEVLASADGAIALQFEFCPTCRELESIDQVERGG